jgi:hypothetical protein
MDDVLKGASSMISVKGVGMIAVVLAVLVLLELIGKAPADIADRIDGGN